MRRTQKKERNSTPAFAVVVDGNTEAWYLQMLKRNERDLRVSIKPEIPTKKSVKEQFDLVCELLGRKFSRFFGGLVFMVVIRGDLKAPKVEGWHLKLFL